MEKDELKQEKGSFFSTPEERELGGAETGGQSCRKQARRAETEPGRQDSHQVGSCQCMLGKWDTSIAGSGCFFRLTGVRSGERQYFAGNWGQK